MPGTNKLIDVKMQIHYQTGKAILASTTGIKADAIWIPKEPCEIFTDAKGVTTVTMPTLLAYEKGLI